MVATVWVLSCVLATGQAAPAASSRPAGWDLAPRLNRGQELVYRGTFTEKASGARVQFQRDYRLEARVFALEAPPRGLDLAVMTTLQIKQAPAPAGVTREAAPSTARLERVFVTPQGQARVTGRATPPVPLDGPPELELGMFVDLPAGKLAVHQSWEVASRGRPTVSWKFAGTETANNQPCAKLVGTQQSDDWGRPRADRPAWRRQDTVWVATRTGLTVKVERTLEQRAPARTEVSQRSVLSYELASSLQYPGQMAMDRRQEVRQALALRDEAAPLTAAPGKHARALAALARKIATHLENTPPTPFRPAVVQMQRQVIAAGKGEVIPVAPPAEDAAPATPGRIALGEPAPDFLATSFTAPGSSRLAQLKGKPAVLVFYHHASPTAEEVLTFAQKLHADFGKHAHVVGLCAHNDARAVLAQRTALKLGFPLLHGAGQLASYAAEGTPKFVVLDAKGVVRAAVSGWGSETASEVTEEVRRCLGEG